MRTPGSLSLLLAICILLSACGDVTVTPIPGVGTEETTTESPLAPTLEPTPTFKFAPTEEMRLTPVDLQAGYGVRGPWFELYFTNPTSPLSSQGTGGVDGPLVEAINAARLSIDVAAYSLTLNSIRNALIRAHDRGVLVRMVMES